MIHFTSAKVLIKCVTSKGNALKYFNSLNQLLIEQFSMESIEYIYIKRRLSSEYSTLRSMQFWRFLGSLCVICLFLFTNANPFSLPRGMPLFDMVDMNKDGVITNEEGLTHPNKAIVKQWLLLLKKIPKRALQDGLTRKEYYKLLSKQYSKLILIINIYCRILRALLFICQYLYSLRLHIIGLDFYF